MKKVTILYLLLLSVFSINAQKHWTEPFLPLIEDETLTLKEKIGAYHMITETYSSYDLKNTYIYGKKGLELALKANDKRMIVTFYRYIASTYTYSASYDTAHIYQQMQIDIAEETGDNDLLLQSYYCLGNLYMRQGRFVQAIENYQKTISYYAQSTIHEASREEILVNLELSFHFFSPRRAYLFCLASAGECYRRLKNYDQALDYLIKAKEYMEATGIDIMGTGHSHIYRELGYVYFAKGDIDTALAYQLKALHESGEITQVTISDCKEALIKIYILKGEYDEALKHAHDCLELATSLGDPFIDVLAWNSFAEIYRAQKLYAKSEAAAMKAWSIDSTSVDTAPVSAINIAYANIHLGNPEKAEYFFRKSIAFNEEKSNKNYQEAIANMEVQYETERKEVRIASLEREKKQYIVLGAIGILLIVALGVFLLQTKRNMQKEKQLLTARAALNGEIGERSRLARDLHDRLSGSLAAVKIGLSGDDYSRQEANNKLDNCIEEIRRVSHNLMPVSLQQGLKTALEDFAAQFPNVRFHFFGEEQRIDERKKFVLYCCANELVNNSLRYSGAECINMQLIQDEKFVSLTVQDDGCGFDERTVEKGFGLKNVYDRVASCDGEIDIVTFPGKGTETTIKFNAGCI